MLQLPENIDYIDLVWPRQAFIIKKVCAHYTGGRIIDIGCGNGKITQTLGRLGVEMLGIDLDAQEIKKAGDSNESENVQFACRDIHEMTEQFSGIVLAEVLEHTADPVGFLKEVYHVCAHEGFLILTIPNGYCVKEMVTAAIHRSARQNGLLTKFIKWHRKMTKRDAVFNESQHTQWFTLKKIRLLLREAGFTIQEETYYSLWSTLLWVCVPWLKVPLWVKKFERKLTNYIPAYLLEGWAFLCLKKNADE